MCQRRLSKPYDTHINANIAIALINWIYVCFINKKKERERQCLMTERKFCHVLKKKIPHLHSSVFNLLIELKKNRFLKTLKRRLQSIKLQVENTFES